MAAYGALRTYAQRLGFSDAAQALQATLDEEGAADKTLTHIAETVVNPQAQNASEEGNGSGKHMPANETM